MHYHGMNIMKGNICMPIFIKVSRNKALYITLSTRQMASMLEWERGNDSHTTNVRFFKMRKYGDNDYLIKFYTSSFARRHLEHTWKAQLY